MVVRFFVYFLNIFIYILFISIVGEGGYTSLRTVIQIASGPRDV